jgi:hypothetical protein
MGRGSGEDEQGNKNDLEPMPSFTEVQHGYENVKSILLCDVVSSKT